MRSVLRFAAAAGIAVAFCSAPASAAIVFSDTFNSYASSAGAGTQAATGLTVKAFGTLSSWTPSGQNAVHAVDRTGAGDWAVMFYGGDTPAQTNAITLTNGIAANAAGATYQVSFEGAAATYAQGSQGNGPGDLIRFDVLRGNGTTLTTSYYDPADWANTATNPFTAGVFSYTGDGSGDVKLRISAAAQNGHFGGAIDNLSIAAVPESANWAMMLVGFGAIGATLRRRPQAGVRFS